MKVTVSAHGKFHAFELARQLARAGALERVLTSDPRILLKRDLPFGRALAFPVGEALARLPSRLRIGSPVRWNRVKTRLHDEWASRLLGHPDVVVAWSGAARRVIEVARRRGAVTVLERGSTHISHQAAILREERALFGLQGGVPATEEAEELHEYGQADFIMVPSKFARQTFLDRDVPAERLLHVPYGSDLSLFSPGPRQDDVFRIVFAGSVSLRKGVPYLLRAFRELLLPRSELILAGHVAPEIEPELRKHDGRFRVVGSLGRTELAALFRRASIFVLPSIEEGLAMVIREALASGLPVIATPNSGAEDAYADGTGGFIVPARDVLALSDRIERLYRDRDLRDEMSRQALTLARRWTWDDYGDAVLAAYRGALAAKGRTAGAPLAPGRSLG